MIGYNPSHWKKYDKKIGQRKVGFYTHVVATTAQDRSSRLR